MLKQTSAKQNLAIITLIYLAGIFMGAIDTGIVTPARTIIQNNLMVSDKTGIWMITIYTLAYAASIPVMGKLADKYGRKFVYLTSICLFGLGSLLCGLSQNFGSFSMLLVARVIQAIGGGGIMPVATAEFGTAYPPEKRGMALGLVGGVYGVANIFGSSAGSAILNLFGMNNWQFIFYINLPITLFIIIAGSIFLKNNKEKNVKKVDKWGILLIVGMVLALLYGLRNIDFFNFSNTFTSINVYPFLIIFIVLLPVFILAEKKAEDPVINLNYFTNIKIVITLVISFIVGIVMMGMIFVPQFSENAVKIASGNGGYFVIILGIFAGAGAPLSGKLIDKFGAKLILSIGFAITIIGSLFLILVTTNSPSMLTVVISLILIGLGMGFTIGTPLNYMMLENTKAEESNSALATLSLIRSIGTAIAPAIMIGFIAHAGLSVQTNVMSLMPNEVTVPPLPYAQELTEKLNDMKSDPNMKGKLIGIEFPDLNSMSTVSINMNSNSGYKMPADLLDLMKTADVTNITSRSETFASRMFDEMTPKVISNIQKGVQKGIDGINSGISEMNVSISDMQKASDGMGEAIKGMQNAVAQQKSALTQLESLYTTIANMQASVPAGMTNGITTDANSFSIISMIPTQIKDKIPASVLADLSEVKTAGDLKIKIDDLNSAIKTLETKAEDTKASQAKMNKAITSIQSAENDMTDTTSKMITLKQAVPSTFDTAKINYIQQIDDNSKEIEAAFQSTLNGGFKQVYLTAAIASALALLILLLYKSRIK